ncbi:hypothetical protein Z517_02062 [Fonsecaea pedrosoi CBS 271.37]|uniref:BTB domain-containing protein n=1 Tax=Fonsecaea pedrosoi CBS 271.37 TaxID=1442368 RepID=A0A0D2HEB4_9EURO|nr:uncharacterized protein Z517_02062 [Fonsecaea pedrosoi CBS 271.37]KIW82819.1 hypothetical protein Z517_02062 [Fonsecaea pedrosoi CBS 271.37]
MLPCCELVVFDPSGELFLLLNRDATQSEVVAHDAHGDDAQEQDVSHLSNNEEPSNNTFTGLWSKTSTQAVEMQVSLKHLSLASKFFANMFGDQSLDLNGHEPNNKEMRTIPLQGDDFYSLQILLNIIHGLTRRVPRQVERNILLQAVILIDKYEFHEVAEVFTDMWFESLRPTLPRNLHRDIASWIYICWSLGKSEEFEALTEIAILETDNGLEDPDVPVPFWIIAEIRSYRREILTEFLSILSSLIDRYEGPRCLCRRDKDCDALLLGKLIKGLKNIGLYPVPDALLLNRSIKSLFAAVRDMELSPLCKELTKKERKGYSSLDDEESFRRTYHLKEELHNSISSLEKKFRGLQLKNGGKSEVRS